MIKDFRNYVIANNLPTRFTEPGAIQILSRVYPCTNGQSLASEEMSQVIGKQVTVQPTGVYATIDTSLMIATIQKLNATKDYENDGVIMRIERNTGDYAPPVLFALARLLWRQGRTDDALLWLNAAWVRSNFDAARCTDISARSAVSLMVWTMPPELLKSQLADPERLLKITERVLEWDERTPYNYDHRWIILHGMDSMSTSLGSPRGPAGPLTVSSDTWPALAQKTRDDYHRDVLKAIEKVKIKASQPGASP